MNKPSLIIVTGRPGSGKSTLAHILAREIRCPLISRDEIKEGYVNTAKIEHNKIMNKENVTIYNVFFGSIELLLDNKITMIAEAAFQHKLWFPKLEALSKKSGLKIIICKAEQGLAYKRYLERKSNDLLREYFHGGAAVSPENTVYEPPVFPVPILEVDTTNGYNPGLPEICSFVSMTAPSLGE